MYVFKLVSPDGGQSMVRSTVRDDASHSDPALDLERGHDVAGVQRMGRRQPLQRRPAATQAAVPRRELRPTVRRERHRRAVRARRSLRLDDRGDGPRCLHYGHRCRQPSRALAQSPRFRPRPPRTTSTGPSRCATVVEAARDRGANLIFMGANASFRRVRLEPSTIGAKRHEVNYRVASDDPLYGKDNAEVTTVGAITDA